jgi:hypothetical protein
MVFGHHRFVSGSRRLVGPDRPSLRAPARGGDLSSRHGTADVRRAEALGTCLALVTPVFTDASRVVRSVTERLPWGFQIPPLRRSSPERCLLRALPPASARCCHTPCVFRPRGLSPPRRLALSGRVQACCILLPTLGFTGFRPAPRRVHPVARLRPLGLVPPLRCSPSSAFPACAAELTSPPAPAPSSFPDMPAGSTSRPCSAPASVARPPCCHDDAPDALLGFPVPEDPPSADPRGSRWPGARSARTRSTRASSARDPRQTTGWSPLHTLAGAFRPDFDSLALCGPAGSTSPPLPAQPPSGSPRPSWPRHRCLDASSPSPGRHPHDRRHLRAEARPCRPAPLRPSAGGWAPRRPALPLPPPWWRACRASPVFRVVRCPLRPTSPSGCLPCAASSSRGLLG